MGTPQTTLLNLQDGDLTYRFPSLHEIQERTAAALEKLPEGVSV